MEEIIAGWTTELEARSRAFVKHAGELAAWDRHILTNRCALLDLEDELRKVWATGSGTAGKAGNVLSFWRDPTTSGTACSIRSAPAACIKRPQTRIWQWLPEDHQRCRRPGSGLPGS